jgi:heme oxygenase (biliverdin-IX-beta and delta-forming)
MSTAMLALREATRAIHDDFENGLKVARPDAGQAEYLVFISAMYGWLQPFEQDLWRPAWPDGMDAAARGQKSAWLERDLRAAGMNNSDIAQLPRTPDSPPLASLAQRFGVAYVMEGAQLGSQVLAPTLKPRLAPWPAHWLSGYGAHAAAYWLSFRAQAEHCLADQAARAEAADAATQAFRTLAHWFRAQGAA